MTGPRAVTDLLPPIYLGGPEITTDNCEREAIHIPGSIQPHGALLVLGDGLQVVQASENVGAFLVAGPETVLGQPLGCLIGEEEAGALELALPPGSPDHLQYRGRVVAGGGALTADLALTAHRTGERLIVELEPEGTPSRRVAHALRNAVFALESAPTLQALAEAAVRAVREISGLDRVMLYRFAADDTGEVIAEDRREDLHPFLGHRFPESDIPAQARALYVRHLLRLTADVDAPPSPLRPLLDPQTGAPAQLGGAVLRATSPMHLRYLRNMGVASSLSVSVVVDGRLWGLISCHHTSPYAVPPEVRSAMEDLGRLLNLQVRLKSRADTDAFRETLRERHERVTGAATHSLTPLAALADPALDLPGLLAAGGAALHFEGQWRTLGAAPAPELLGELLDWLRAQAGDDPLYVTESLSTDWAPGAAVIAQASGLLALSVGRGWNEAVLWFRPEIVREVAWGGATPDRAKDDLGPRRSFDTYLERVRAYGEPWHPGEVEEARDLQRTLSAALGERLSTLRRLNEALERSAAEWRQYAFVIAHDMQEPVRLISQFVELFRLRYGGQIDPGAEQLIGFVVGETGRLRGLTTDLYAYTELQSAARLHSTETSLQDALRGALAELAPLVASRTPALELPETWPTVRADPVRLRELLTHLLRNALIFSAPYPVRVALEVRALPGAGGWAVTVRDDGPGIAPEYHEKIFQIFQRLGRNDASGNGLGLALARKIAQLHGSDLTVESGPGQGSAFTFTLPSAGGEG
ncbi:ATP-binding protein [Deinococcus sp. Leaf326]|uniref:ATP-binding protein n=1 Tax=Deinococcus sp. Leaf326 TaxID=1736338 RepID=UPI0006F34BC1|nr:ATP-binding protein [Deinococcus sp. Leaf326]KQR40904.1 histidine kinase [Deinococcus sp. Leaf326]